MLESTSYVSFTKKSKRLKNLLLFLVKLTIINIKNISIKNYILDTNKEIKKVFELFTEKKFKEAQELNNQILEVQPNNMYAKRYAGILADKIKFENTK
jgi:hypothetical protein